MEWTYSVGIAGIDGGDSLFVADPLPLNLAHRVVDPDAPGGGSETFTHGLFESAPNAGPQVGSARVRVGLLSNAWVGYAEALGWPSDQVPPPRHFADEFHVSVTIRDAGSAAWAFGATGTGSVTSGPGLANLATDLDVDGRAQDRVLGDTRYRVRFEAERLETGAWLVADVQTSPATAATPEPGTLALAGLGLAGVGLRRARRASQRGR